MITGSKEEDLTLNMIMVVEVNGQKVQSQSGYSFAYAVGK